MAPMSQIIITRNMGKEPEVPIFQGSPTGPKGPWDLRLGSMGFF
jgi:hypothetical protein